MAKDEVHEGEGFVLYGARWHMLFGYAILSMLNAVIWISFASIDNATAVFYDISIGDVNLLALVFQILYLPGFLFALYIIEASSLRRSLVLGSALGASGGILRALSTFVSDDSSTLAYALVMAGQCLVALAQPIFLSTAANVAGNWFPVTERDVAVTVGSLFNPLGNALGQVIPPFVVIESDDDDGLTRDAVRAGMQRLLVGQAATLILGFIWTYLYFKSHPPTPPSQSAFNRLEARANRLRAAHNTVPRRSSDHKTLEEYEEELEEDAAIPESPTEVFHELVHNFQVLLHDKSFLLLLVGFSVGLAIFNALLTVIAQWLEPYGYSNDQAGLAGGALIVCGLVGAACAAIILDTYHCFREVLKGSFICAFITLIGLTLCLQTGNLVLLLVGAGALGFFCLPILPGVIENAVESTYPIPEEASSGLLFCCGNIMGIAFTEVLAKLVKMGNTDNFFTPSTIFLLGSILFALLFVIPYNGEYKRLAAERSSLQSPLLDHEHHENDNKLAPPPPPDEAPSPTQSDQNSSHYSPLVV